MDPTTPPATRTDEPLTLRPVSGIDSGELRIDARGGGRLGRSLECELCVEDPSVSRHHATFVSRDGRWFLTDLGARHVTRLNGTALEPRQPTLVADGDLAQFGRSVFRVVIGSGRPGIAITTVDDKHGMGGGVQTICEPAADWKVQRRLTLLIECATSVYASGTESELAEVVLRSALDGTGFPRAAYLRRRGSSEEVELVASDGRDTDAASISRTLIREASSGRLVSMGAASIPTSHSIAELGIHSALCAPIQVGGVVTAFLYLDARGSETSVHAEAAEFVAALAHVAGLALANLNRADLEHRHRELIASLDAAREAQQLIVPAATGDVAGFTYAMRMHPGMVVAGDMFDVVPLTDDRVVVCLGDVSGAGVSAGILMAATQAHLHATLRQNDDPAAAVTAVNRYVASHSALNRFVSLWVGLFDRSTGIVRYVDAGHGHWVCVSGGKSIAGVAGDPPAGIDESHAYRVHEREFDADERIVLFSDGVVEQRSSDGTCFGLDRVIEVLAGTTTTEEDVTSLFEAIGRFAGTDVLDDDTTVASVGRT